MSVAGESAARGHQAPVHYLTEAVDACNTTLGHVAQVSQSLPTLEAARARLFYQGAALFDEPDTLAAHFPSPGAYYTALARLGRNPNTDSHDVHNTTARMVTVLRELHVPETLVYLRTDDRRNRLAGSKYALGRIASTPRVRLLEQYGDPMLLLDVSTTAVNGSPVTSEVSMDDIASTVDSYGSSGTLSPIIGLGPDVIHQHLASIYNLTNLNRLQRPSTPQVLAALCTSGVKLHDLSFDPVDIASMADRYETRLNNYYRGYGPYSSELAYMVPLFEDNATALAFVDERLFVATGIVLANRAAPTELNRDFVQDYRRLERAQTQETLTARNNHHTFRPPENL